MKDEIESIRFQGNFQYIRLARPIRVWINAGMSWISGLEELRSLALQNPDVPFEAEANGVTFTAIYKGEKK